MQGSIDRKIEFYLEHKNVFLIRREQSDASAAIFMPKTVGCNYEMIHTQPNVLLLQVKYHQSLYDSI